jgi:alkanesulfonate monooxygenase SsuD/methylene tetrahydromethanopterin reductase-like flavin-dependent oxidoreductase (luciferase family)
MSPVLQLTLAVGAPAGASLGEAAIVAAVAEESGVAALRLVDAPGRTLDPTVAAAYLAGLHGILGYLPEIPTTHHAPYNVARRVLSLDRATQGRAGVVLRPGGGDEVTEATLPDSPAAAPARRWTEYARVLTRLWESFPRRALIGDQAAGLVVDDSLIRPIDHEGASYRVAGPLDGPSSVQGRPVVVADLGVLDATAVAASADVVVADRQAAAGADVALTRALGRAGRSRGEVALLGRAAVTRADLADAAGFATGLLSWATERRLDGFELVPQGGAEVAVAAVRALAPLLAGPPGSPPPTLRAAFGLREVTAVPA